MRNLLALIFIAVFCSNTSAQESKYIVFTGLTDIEADSLTVIEARGYEFAEY